MDVRIAPEVVSRFGHARLNAVAGIFHGLSASGEVRLAMASVSDAGHWRSRLALSAKGIDREKQLDAAAQVARRLGYSVVMLTPPASQNRCAAAWGNCHPGKAGSSFEDRTRPARINSQAAMEPLTNGEADVGWYAPPRCGLGTGS